jgi:hypothetical protein
MRLLAVLGVLVAVATAPQAHADDSDFIRYLYQHDLGCGQGALKCTNDSDLLTLGRSVCFDIDKNGQTPVQASDKLMEIGDGYLNKSQALALTAAAVVNFCPWDQV